MLWSRDHDLEIRVHSSSFCRGRGLQTWRPRARSWSQDGMLGAYACSMITVICSTFKRVLCHQLEFMQPVMWFRDHGLETRVHSSSFCPGLGLETWWPRSRSWSRDLKTVLTTTLTTSWRNLTPEKYKCACTHPQLFPHYLSKCKTVTLQLYSTTISIKQFYS